MKSDNHAITEATKPVRVEELTAPGRIVAIEGKGGTKRWRAKVSQADKKNQNGRIYPRAVLEAEIDRLMPRLADGVLGGAVDHLGWSDGGNLKHTCILWRSLEIDADGAMWGEFEIIEHHAAGKDFKAQCESGLAVGFSTFGYGTGRDPTESERRQYGLSDDEEVIIMKPDYVLKKIDAVDDPSVVDARLKRECVERSGDRDDEADTSDALTRHATTMTAESMLRPLDLPDEFRGRLVEKIVAAILNGGMAAGVNEAKTWLRAATGLIPDLSDALIETCLAGFRDEEPFNSGENEGDLNPDVDLGDAKAALEAYGAALAACAIH
jgi:hypothetical protein